MDSKKGWPPMNPQRREPTFTELLNSPALDFPGASESPNSLLHAHWQFNGHSQGPAALTSLLSNWYIPQCSLPQSLSEMTPYPNVHQQKVFSQLLPETMPRHNTYQENVYSGLLPAATPCQNSYQENWHPLNQHSLSLPVTMPCLPVTSSSQPVATPRLPATTPLQPSTMSLQPTVMASSQPVTTLCQPVGNTTAFIAYLPPMESDCHEARRKEQTKKTSVLETGTASTSSCLPVQGTTGPLPRLQDDVNASSLPGSMPTPSASVQPCQQPEPSSGHCQERQDAETARSSLLCSAQAFDDDNDEEQALTWAGCNPTKPVTEKQQRRSRKGQNDEARKIHKNKQQEQRIIMAEEIQAAQDRFHEELTDIAMKYDRTFEAIVNMVSYSSKYKKKWAPLLYLAKLSAKADEVNQDKPIGEKVPLARIREMLQEEEEALGSC
ncbi:hypothetical protein IW261DRAFT_1571960 [Armillaria novae-zelandiae]|uniref:Uncharacterized protein n=1 Tax=Armillaria novae-zelandiae TaxID=153914 RepID=A0AA39NTL7_9AGAR|nr:hypothetical protein IW261DRAFT_1571960 [Armillaria novae-zelandiae]